MNKVISTLTIALSLAATIFAGPKIEFDTKSFNSGVAIEGVTEKIQATFIVKNTGDSTLKLISVKPGCGCTVVKFDSIIAPGKTTKIESEVNIKGYHSGPLSKSISVVSNAEKDPVRLTIDATIQAAIDASETYLRFDSSSVKGKTIFLTSQKADLKISGVTFTTDNVSDDAKKGIRIPITYKFNQTDSVRPDGYKVYKLELTTPKYDSNLYGTFAIATNHPDRKEVLIRGNFSK